MPGKTAAKKDPYSIDFPRRVKDIQTEMPNQGIDVYLGSRLRTLSWTLDAFCPWRSYIPGWTRSTSWDTGPWAARTRSAC